MREELGSRSGFGLCVGLQAKLWEDSEKCAMEGDRALPELHSDFHRLMVRTGDRAMAHFRGVSAETKQDSTPVTIADRECESLLFEELGKLFPDDGLCGEEGGLVEGRTGRIWYVDPIDGTSAFLEGLAHWGPVVGCMDDKGPFLGAVYMPRTKDFFFAVRGQGAWLNGKALPRLQGRSLSDADVLYVPSKFHQHVVLDFQGKCRNLGGTAAHLCGVAAGSAIGALIPRGWKLWDVVGPFCLLNEVSALAFGQDSGVLDLQKHPSQSFVVGHEEVIRELLQPGRFQLKSSH